MVIILMVIGDILSMVIGDYSIVSHWWLFYWWLLMVILLVAIIGYFIDGYCIINY